MCKCSRLSRFSMKDDSEAFREKQSKDFANSLFEDCNEMKVKYFWDFVPNGRLKIDFLINSSSNRNFNLIFRA
ncbi:MAG: hypothetical protein MHMPM18_004595 [Marteilia pararefringens]